jgi:hypothetical protein
VCDETWRYLVALAVLFLAVRFLAITSPAVACCGGHLGNLLNKGLQVTTTSDSTIIK